MPRAPGPHLLTQPVTVAALARYFSGGVLAGAPTVWQVTTSVDHVHAAELVAVHLRRVEAVLAGRHRPADEFGPIGFSAATRRMLGVLLPAAGAEGGDVHRRRTDATGNHYLQLNFDGEKPDLPVMVSANASVTDVNRQSFASNLEVLVHPSSLYVGIRSTRQFVREGEPIDIEAIVTDIDGKAVAGRKFTITATRVESSFENGDVGRHRRGSRSTARSTSATKPVSCSIKAGVGGQYKITAVVTDDAGGRNRSEFTRWVSGADTVPTRGVEQESATVVPDKDTYRPGDTARVARRRPVRNGHGLLAVSANGATADPALRRRARLGGRRGADRRHRHARAHGAGRPRRAGAETARRRNQAIRRFRRVRPSRPHRCRCR